MCYDACEQVHATMVMCVRSCVGYKRTISSLRTESVCAIMYRTHNVSFCDLAIWLFSHYGTFSRVRTLDDFGSLKEVLCFPVLGCSEF